MSTSIEKYFCAVACLDRTTWQVYMADCFLQYTFEFHSSSQQRGDEDTASSQSRSETQQEERGISKVFSRGENNVPRNKDRPLLYFWQVFHRDADRISIVNVGMVPLAIQFVFDVWVPSFFIQDVPWRNWKLLQLLRHPSLLEIEVVSLFPSSPSSQPYKKLI